MSLNLNCNFYLHIHQKAIETGEGQTCWLKSIGINQKGEQVSEFDFEWTIKVK